MKPSHQICLSRNTIGSATDYLIFQHPKKQDARQVINKYNNKVSKMEFISNQILPWTQHVKYAETCLPHLHCLSDIRPD